MKCKASATIELVPYMKWALALALSTVALGLPCAAATVKSKTRVATKKAGISAKSTASGKGKSGHVIVASRGRAVRGRRGVRVAAGPPVQNHPDTERYQQIQQALAERGYYKGEVSGAWNADSVDALKHFQADQKLEPDGKINSWSLINLGLGPKHDGSSIAATSISASSPPVAPPSTGVQPSN